jgi:hypothetical protein
MVLKQKMAVCNGNNMKQIPSVGRMQSISSIKLTVYIVTSGFYVVNSVEIKLEIVKWPLMKYKVS